MNRKALTVMIVATWMALLLQYVLSGLHYVRADQLQQDVLEAEVECARCCSEVAELRSELETLRSYTSTEIRWLKYSQSHMGEDLSKARSEVASLRIELNNSREEQVTEEEAIVWTKFSGRWVVTYYGSEEDGLLGWKHGAAEHGLTCKDYASLTTDMPDVVTKSHYGIALSAVGDAKSGSEYYCKPVKICVRGNCVTATAVGVPRDYILTKDGLDYYHADVWYQAAKDLGILDAGIVWGDVEVYIGDE